jgi:hypothetical protein
MNAKSFAKRSSSAATFFPWIALETRVSSVWNGSFSGSTGAVGAAAWSRAATRT